MNREEGLATICAAVADCLGVDPREVTPESRLITDLAATSLDILDLIFTLEGRFGTKIRNAELDAFLRGELVSADAVQGGFLVPSAIERLSKFLPALATVPDRARVTPASIVGFITVESMWLLVEERVLK